MIKSYLRKLFGLIVFILLSLSTKAAGFYGGEVSIRNILGNAYSVKFVAYKDCNSCQPPSMVSVTYKCNSNSQFTFTASSVAVLSMNHDITHACPAYPTHCNNGNNFGVKSAVYMGTITLPPGDWDIQVGTSYGTRVGYTNASGEQGWFMHCKFNNSQGVVPLITYPDYPPFIFLQNQPATINYSAHITSDDSLVYSFYHPYKTSTTHISYSGSYTKSSFINSSSPIVLDSTTGILSFTPTSVGSYIVGVKCEQYHQTNGTYHKVGTFFRESVILVKYSFSHAPQLSISSANAIISNNSIQYCQADTPLSVYLNIQTFDLDTISPFNKVFIKYSDSIPGASFLTYNNGDTNASAILLWQPTADDLQKTHHFTITLSDSACPYNLVRSYPFQIKFEAPPPTFNLGNDTSLYFTHVLFLKLPIAEKYLWSTGDTNQMLIVADILNYSNPITGTVFNQADCSTSDSINVLFNQVGIQQQIATNCKIYPNPNRGSFYVELKTQGKQNYKIQIFDALGKEIYNQTIEFENYKKLKIDLENQPSGIYQLRIVSREDVISRRIIIQ